MTPRNIRADLVDDIYRRLLVDIERDVHGNDRAILVQGDEGPAQALHRLHAATKLPFPRRPPHSFLSVPRKTPGVLTVSLHVRADYL
jgi:hypothetical protein